MGTLAIWRNPLRLIAMATSLPNRATFFFLLTFFDIVASKVCLIQTHTGELERKNNLL